MVYMRARCTQGGIGDYLPGYTREAYSPGGTLPYTQQGSIRLVMPVMGVPGALFAVNNVRTVDNRLSPGSNRAYR